VRLRTIAILRRFDPQKAVDIAERCWAAGMDLVEVPVQGEAGWASLEAVADCAGNRPFGAGTVLTVADAERAVSLGAGVVISPAIDRDVVEATQGAGALPLPGVMTPTDVATAAALGLEACKLFPATVVGPGWVSALRGPFPAMRFVAVGGVDLRNASEFISMGACGVGFGSNVETLLARDNAAEVIAELHRLAERQTLNQPV